MICPACQEWMQPEVDKEAGTLRCPDCTRLHPHRFLPIFIVTGPSGAGKTTVIPDLNCLLPDWDMFETDLLWDSAGNWTMVKCNWLRIGHSLVQRGRPTILLGTMNPNELAECESLPFFSRVHWLALLCEEKVLEERLRARPAWRESTEAFIRESMAYNRWFRDHAETDFHPPLTILDTTHESPAETARRIALWAAPLWIEELSRT